MRQDIKLVLLMLVIVGGLLTWTLGTNQASESWCTDFPPGKTENEFVAEGQDQGYSHLGALGETLPRPDASVTITLSRTPPIGYPRQLCTASIQFGRVQNTAFSSSN